MTGSACGIGPLSRMTKTVTRGAGTGSTRGTEAGAGRGPSMRRAHGGMARTRPIWNRGVRPTGRSPTTTARIPTPVVGCAPGHTSQASPTSRSPRPLGPTPTRRAVDGGETDKLRASKRPRSPPRQRNLTSCAPMSRRLPTAGVHGARVLMPGSPFSTASYSRSADELLPWGTVRRTYPRKPIGVRDREG